MQINSVEEYNRYNRYKQLNNQYKNKRKKQEGEQHISFAEAMEKIKSSIHKDSKGGTIKRS